MPARPQAQPELGHRALADPRVSVPLLMALQPPPCLTVTAADPALDFIYVCDEELFEFLV